MEKNIPFSIPSSGSKIKKTFELQFSSLESSKVNKCSVRLFFIESIDSKYTPWENSRFSLSSCRTSWSGWECRWKKLPNLQLDCRLDLKFVWSVPFFSQSCDLPISVLDGTTNYKKTRVRAKKKLVHSFGQCKLNPALLQKFPTSNKWIVTSLWKMNSPKAIKYNQQSDRKVGETQSKIWNIFVPIKATIFFLNCCRQRQFRRDFLNFFWSII